MVDSALVDTQPRSLVLNADHPATLEGSPSESPATASPRPDPNPAAPLNVVVTSNEVTNLHGTGALLKRVCKAWSNVFSIRARNDWGAQDFGDWEVCLSPRGRMRADFFSSVLNSLRDRNVRTTLCVPFLPDEFYTSIAIQECFGAKLCVYLMDDQNVACRNIPDALMRELLERCSLRLATHPELKAAYEQKYGMPFSVLPAVVPASLVATESTPERPAVNGGRRAALLGSFWDQSWYDRLCNVLSQCSWGIDWFGNNKSPFLDLSPASLIKAGITAHGIIPEEALARSLSQYPFVIVPVGALDEADSNTGVAWLSLPGRILFAAATSHTPVLVVGSERTCGARFVRHFGIGEAVPYDASAVSDAMNRMSKPDAQEQMRHAASRIAPLLSDAGISDWLARSIEMGAPADCRFEPLFSDYDLAINLPRASGMGQDVHLAIPKQVDAIVAHIEINDHHGVGVLLKRLFGEYKDILSIRSHNYYEGRQEFGKTHVCISHPGLSRAAVMSDVLQAVDGAAVQRVLCVPYFPDDALTAIALREAFGVPLCTFLMDDQNLGTDGIPDSIMAELLGKSALRLAISPEMCTAYERKYGCKFWFMPPLAPTRLIPQRVQEVSPEILQRREGIILGNIWGQQWMELLRETVRGSGMKLRWYNNGEFPWLPCSKTDLIDEGIIPEEGPPDPDDTFVEILRQAPFIVVPSGTLEPGDDRRFIAQLSFPSRIPYILATSHTPILVMGSRQTTAARLVEHYGIGMSVPYQREAFLEAIERITDPEVNSAMRRTAFLLSVRFADAGAAEWIWQSLARRKPFDHRYQDLIP
jgi:hypothetical protein